jgi:hypothetical protein
MGPSSLDLTMNVHTDPSPLDVAGALSACFPVVWLSSSPPDLHSPQARLN